MDKKKVFLIIGVYIAVVVAALFAIMGINRTLEKRIPSIYKELSQEGSENFEIGKYNLSLVSYDYFRESGTAYMVWNATSDDGRRPEMGVKDDEMVPDISIGLFDDGMTKVAKRVYNQEKLVLCVFAQLNETGHKDSISLYVRGAGNDDFEFKLKNSNYSGERYSADTSCMGKIDITDMAIVINYNNEAPEIKALLIKRKFNSDYQITNNEVIDTVYDTGNEIVLILRKKIDLNGAEGLVANAEEVPLTVEK